MTNPTCQRYFEQEFHLNDDMIHLNHAAVGPWPARTVSAITSFAQENLSMGSKNYLQWLERETQLRKSLSQLINAYSHNEIALVKNTSEALSFVAYGLQWQPGDNVVITDHEFPFNHIVWESLAGFEVELRIANTRYNENTRPEDNILALCDEKTRLVSVSSIQYSTGLKLNLNPIGDFCRQYDILFCIDAIQSVGAMPFDVQQCKADFAMADGHKWMLAPEGLGFFYCRAESLEKLQLKQYGWHMLENLGDYDNTHWEIARSARRFECGSPNLLGAHALGASLSLIMEAGMDTVSASIKDNTRFMLDCIKHDSKLELISPDNPDMLGGIVTFKHKDKDSQSLYQHLQANNVLCAMRGGGIRFSPHFYTPREKIRQAFTLLEQCQ